MVLATLAHGDAHGFEILTRLEDRGRGLLRLREGTLYPALYRLEDAGLIRGEWEDNAMRGRGPRRRIYSLTAKGRRELSARRSQWREFVTIVGNIVEAPS